MIGEHLCELATISTVTLRRATSGDLREPIGRSHRWPSPGRCGRERKKREPDEHEPQRHGYQRIAADLPLAAVDALQNR